MLVFTRQRVHDEADALDEHGGHLVRMTSVCHNPGRQDGAVVSQLLYPGGGRFREVAGEVRNQPRREQTGQVWPQLFTH